MSTTVYIVDGDLAVRDSLATVVGLYGRDAVTFATGYEFLSQRDPSKRQCIVCEAQLPDTTGLAVYRALASESTRHPFALMMSQSNLAFVFQANRLGIENVFFKPLVNQKLISFVTRMDAAPHERL